MFQKKNIEKNFIFVKIVIQNYHPSQRGNPFRPSIGNLTNSKCLLNSPFFFSFQLREFKNSIPAENLCRGRAGRRTRTCPAGTVRRIRTCPGRTGSYDSKTNTGENLAEEFVNNPADNIPICLKGSITNKSFFRNHIRNTRF